MLIKAFESICRACATINVLFFKLGLVFLVFNLSLAIFSCENERNLSGSIFYRRSKSALLEWIFRFWNARSTLFTCLGRCCW